MAACCCVYMSSDCRVGGFSKHNTHTSVHTSCVFDYAIGTFWKPLYHGILTSTCRFWLKLFNCSTARRRHPWMCVESGILRMQQHVTRYGRCFVCPFQCCIVLHASFSRMKIVRICAVWSRCGKKCNGFKSQDETRVSACHACIGISYI